MRYREVRASGAREGVGPPRRPPGLEPHAVRKAAETLRAGGLLAHPTGTVYGIGGAPEPAVDALIARLKGTGAGKPLIRLAPDLETARAARPQARWDRVALRLAAEFWPGPLTLVLDDGTETGFAVRVEPHPAVRTVLEESGGLMSSTSLNRSGEVPAATPAEARRVLASFEEAPCPVLFLEAGELPGPPPSTLLSLRGREPRLLREGAIPRRRVLRALEAVG